MPRGKVAPVINKLSSLSVNNVMYALLLVSFFLLGYLLAKVQTLEGNTGTGGTQAVAQAPINPGQPAPGKKVDVKNGHLPVLGDEDAKVTIVEFSDLQCPFCRRYFIDTFSKIKKDYVDTGKVKVYFRHYPLTFHPMAKPSAEAAECASEQGKFWEMHDKMFEEQEKQGQGTITYTNDDMKNWAADLGLDSNKFNQCLDSNKYAAKVDEDFQDGQKAGVTGTPTFFVNGEMLVGAQPYESFKAIIDKQLQ